MKTPAPEEAALITAVIEAGLAEPWNALPADARKRWVAHVLAAQTPEARARRTDEVCAALRPS